MIALNRKKNINVTSQVGGGGDMSEVCYECRKAVVKSKGELTASSCPSVVRVGFFASRVVKNKGALTVVRCSSEATLENRILFHGEFLALVQYLVFRLTRGWVRD